MTSILCSAVQSNPKLKRFRDAATFLEPMSEQDLACAMDLCSSKQDCGMNPKMFKCAIGDNNVELTSFDAAGLKEAELQCGAGSDLHMEPTGGAGGIIVNPTPDNRLASDLVSRAPRRATAKRTFRLASNIFIFLFALQVILLFINYMI